MRVAYFVVALFLAACGDGSSGSSREVEISWTANRETAVNAPGGGYRVYYASTAQFDIASAKVIDVPYRTGGSAPTSTVVTFAPGTHYIKVLAYSAMNPAGSAPSVETEVQVY